MNILTPRQNFSKKNIFYWKTSFYVEKPQKLFWHKFHHIYRNYCWKIAIKSQKTLPRPAKKSKKYNLLKIDSTHNLECFGPKKFFWRTCTLRLDLKYNLHKKIKFVLSKIEKVTKNVNFETFKIHQSSNLKGKREGMYKVFKYCFGHLE